MRSRYTINPDRVYRIAMRKLNTSAGILEVMGAPLTGTDLRAYVMSGGGITQKNFQPKLRGKRCFLIFPIQGSERRGLVSVEVKKKKGQVSLYDHSLLVFGWFLIFNIRFLEYHCLLPCSLFCLNLRMQVICQLLLLWDF